MNYGIILLGGDSLRTSTYIPKQYFVIKGKEIFLYSFEIFLKHPNIDKILLVVNETYQDYVRLKVLNYHPKKEINVISGGYNRQDSSFLALNYIKNHEKNLSSIKVFIHDASRPLLTTKVLNDVILESKNCEALTTYFPIYDSICTSKDSKTIDGYRVRSETFSIQTPQAFDFNLIYKAHLKAINEKWDNINDDSVLVKKYGRDVKLVLGDKLNFKITTIDDIFLVAKIIGD